LRSREPGWFLAVDWFPVVPPAGFGAAGGETAAKAPTVGQRGEAGHDGRAPGAEQDAFL
jgi:hypothetical protein